MCARHTRVFSLNIDRHRHQIIHEIQATNCRVKLHPFRLLLDTEALPHIGGYRFKARFLKRHIQNVMKNTLKVTCET